LIVICIEKKETWTTYFVYVVRGIGDGLSP